MSKISFRSALSGLVAGLALATLGSPAFAAGERVIPPAVNWSFAGPFGKYDQAQLQRGFKIAKEVCASCHSMNLLRFRNLSEPGGPGFTTSQVAALAQTYTNIKDGPNDAGEMFDRPGRPADAFPAPFPNEQAARAANGGAYPPDLSVLAKARTYERGFPWFVFDIFTQYQEQGPDYIAALLNGYKDPPQGFALLPGQNYNEYMPGHVLAMPKPLNDGQVEYPKGEDGKSPVPETVEQYSKDVAAFMMWMAEPHLNARKQMGFVVMLFLALFAGLLYFTKKKIWSRLPDHAAAH
jgi:ubiquinol-cytochrome c reductase cytochrome b/c1 subunit